MTAVESRLRDAARALAEAVPDSSLRPLWLPRVRPSARPPVWLASLAAALAVITGLTLTARIAGSPAAARTGLTGSPAGTGSGEVSSSTSDESVADLSSPPLSALPVGLQHRRHMSKALDWAAQRYTHSSVIDTGSVIPHVAAPSAPVAVTASASPSPAPGGGARSGRSFCTATAVNHAAVTINREDYCPAWAD